MTDLQPTPPVQPDAGEEQPQTENARQPQRSWEQIWDRLVRTGMGEISLQVGGGVVSFLLILLVVWVMGRFYLRNNTTNTNQAVQATPEVTAAPTVQAPIFESGKGGQTFSGISRLAQLHTTLPDRPRFEVVQYEVQKGDTLFAIAERFNLHPESLLWGNYEILADDPHRLRPGQKLNILPVDGVYYQWHTGDGLTGVAKFYGVTTDDILSWPGNHLDAAKVGDPGRPNIASGTWLMIPGGRREFISWSAPRITRDNPAVAKIFGPGYCGKVAEGPVGLGTFVWPTTEKFLSGYDFSPETNHWGVDIAGSIGNAIFAADGGVVVYAGWNDWGYGNVIVIDHGNGWQTLYAHLSAIAVQCSSYVAQGGVIGSLGSTGNSSGPHLHFEMLSDTYGRANPWNFLAK